tara:strand:- start:851 stop:1828 length:978 start_codon:yes stop_codon:yes gene_type:complete
MELNNGYVCIVSFGNIAKRHFNILRKYYPNLKIVIVSKNQTKYKNAIIYENIEKIKKLKIYLAIICSPASLHISHANFFLKKNIPTFIEKPFSSNHKEVINLLNKYKNKKIYLIIGYVFRFHSQAQKIKKLLEIKKIGAINYVKVNNFSYLPEWRQKDYRKSVSAIKSLGGGVLNELSHEIDLLYWFFGRFNFVNCQLTHSNKLDIETEDDCVFEFLKGKMRVFGHLNFSEKFHKERTILISGNNGLIYWDLNNSILKIKSEKFNKTYASKENLYNEMYEYQIKFLMKNFLKSKRTTNKKNLRDVSELIHSCKISSEKNKSLRLR